MLQIGISNTVRFNVEVHGTSTEPTMVRLVIALSGRELGFIATKSEDKWQADVTIPADVQEGQYEIRVEVTVNNRLFTPLKRRVPINKATSAPAPDVPAAAPSVAPPAVVPEPVVRPPMPPLPTIEKKSESLFKKVVENKHEQRTEPKPKQPVAENKPEPQKPPVAKKKKDPIRINIAEIVADSNKRFEKVLQESPSYRKPIKPVKAIDVKPQTPISLKKGEVVYE